MCLFRKKEPTQQFDSGEKVRILYNKYNGYGNRYIGQIKTIEEKCAMDCYTIVEDDYPGKVWFFSKALQKVSQEELETIKNYEKINKTKTKIKNKNVDVEYFNKYTSLKAGDIVTFRDGKKFPINVHNKIIIEDGEYRENMFDAKELCIIKVERPIEYKVIFKTK